MSAVAESVTESLLPAIWSMPQEQQIATLQGSLYPGAQAESVAMVLSYCRAAGLDPLLKPVHIVPMSVKTGRDSTGDIYENRDVVLPGIGLYRITAARTCQYAGMEEPVFGPARTLSYKKKVTEWVTENNRRKKIERWEDATLEYPEWVRVVVYRIVGGVRCAFPAVEFWMENYATAGKWTDAPNAMWTRRPRGQLVKCAEAQALRKAFPEVGSMPTAEEMEGRVIEADELRTIDGTASQVSDDLMPRERPTGAPAGSGDEKPPIEEEVATTPSSEGDSEGARSNAPAGAATPAGKPITEPMLRILKKKAASNNVTEGAICQRFGVASLDALPMAHVNEAMRLAGGAK